MRYTYLNDDAYQVLSEVESRGKPSQRTSWLEHTWTINVTGGELTTLYVEAHHSANADGDDFRFAYSTDNVNSSRALTPT